MIGCGSLCLIVMLCVFIEMFMVLLDVLNMNRIVLSIIGVVVSSGSGSMR